MQVFGHRGASGPSCPENTFISFAHALESYADGIELDVWRCQSGELVVLHDQKVDRTTDGIGHVTQKTLDELKALNIKDPTETYLGLKIPTLTEVLDYVDKRAIVNIEIKGPGIEDLVCKTALDYIKSKDWPYDKIIISSFDHNQLLNIRRKDKHLRTGALYSGVPVGYNKFVQSITPFSVHPDCDTVTKELVGDAHTRNMKVYTWTVNDEETLDRMIWMKVDGIITDFPKRMRYLLNFPEH